MLKLFNTLTKKKETFKPLKDKIVNMYSCGPTVYDFAHIGNFRAYIFNDILKRYLEYKGFKVKHVMNLTDVDDKTIRGAHAFKISLAEFTKKYSDAFFEDIKTLNIKPASVYPRATMHIQDMVGIIKQLMRKGIAYRGEDESIYYNIRKFKSYGKLSGLHLKGLKAGARVKQDQYTKEDAQDFALWKIWDFQDGNVFWETEIGKGRPGWHIECSAMSMRHLGQTFDIHTGGVDLVFPHHENEIAQSEGITGKKFVKYWVHCEHLLVNNQKMSKSLGNFYTLRDLLNKGYSPAAIRYILLSTHYRQKLNFTFVELAAAKNTVEKIFNFVERLEEVTESRIPNPVSSAARDARSEAESKSPKVKQLIKKLKADFEKSMDNNLDTPNALATLFNFIREINRLIDKKKISQRDAAEVVKAIFNLDQVLGLLDLREAPKKIAGLDEKVREVLKKFVPPDFKVEKDNLETQMRAALALREKLRSEKNFKDADVLREELLKIGIKIEDTEEGPKWKLVK